jgi:hypothetical protein
VGDGGWVEAALLLAAAELSGSATAPREEGEWDGSVRVEGRGGVGCGRGGEVAAVGEEAAEHCRRRNWRPARDKEEDPSTRLA